MCRTIYAAAPKRDGDYAHAFKKTLERCRGSAIATCGTRPPMSRLRSKGGDVSISELAFHDDPVKLYAAAQPVTMWGDCMEVGSTHNGESSRFAGICKDAKAYAEGKRELGGRPLSQAACIKPTGR